MLLQRCSKSALLTAAMWLILAGCGAKQGLQSTGMSGPVGGFSYPQVFQTGKTPVNWTQFKWGDTTFGPAQYNDITTAGGNIWYTDYSGNKLIKMTMSGGATAFHLTCTCPTAATLFYPGGITTGKDGKLYVGTSSPSGYIGIATQTGSLSVKKIPSGDQTYFGGGAIGPDGNVWFTELGHYAKITTGGVITEFKYPDGNTANYYGAVTSGPNAYVWMIESNKSQVDEVDPDTGSLTSYNLPCQPTGIMAGRDGNVYAQCSSYLLRITGSGSWAQIYLPGLTDGGYPSFFRRGPDGNPWWTVSGENILATYNTAANTLTAYLPPATFSASYGIIAGPDGNVWALDSNKMIDVYIVNVLNFTPKPLTFTSIGQTITITVTEPGTNAWTAKSSNTAIATVTAGAAANLFNVKAIAKGGATITVQDAIGNSTNTTASVP